MHLRNIIQVATTGFFLFFPQTVLGNPVALSSRSSTLRQARAATVQTAADDFADLSSYGSLLLRGDSGLGKRGIATRLQKIRCGINGGGLTDYDEGRKRFGYFMDGIGSVALMGAKFALQNRICNHETCDMVISVSLQTPGWLLKDQIDVMFDKAFDDLRKECADKGGMAELVAVNIKDSGACGIPTCTADGTVGLKLGSFEAQFYPHDGGDTCPANTAQQVCKIESFN
ncbi:hypothetical protein TruAng_002877 [Truncatella angustata]|nr:hypothetical protein TruAng_002877 [Truncatella angustata]